MKDIREYSEPATRCRGLGVDGHASCVSLRLALSRLAIRAHRGVSWRDMTWITMRTADETTMLTDTAGQVAVETRANHSANDISVALTKATPAPASGRRDSVT